MAKKYSDRPFEEYIQLQWMHFKKDITNFYWYLLRKVKENKPLESFKQKIKRIKSNLKCLIALDISVDQETTERIQYIENILQIQIFDDPGVMMVRRAMINRATRRR